MDREVIILLYEIGLDNNQILKLQMYPELVDFIKHTRIYNRLFLSQVVYKIKMYIK